MEQIINPAANSEIYITETNSSLAELDTKLKKLETQYTETIKSKDATISMLRSRRSILNSYLTKHGFDVFKPIEENDRHYYCEPGDKVEFKDGKAACTKVSQTKDEIIAEKDAKIKELDAELTTISKQSSRISSLEVSLESYKASVKWYKDYLIKNGFDIATNPANGRESYCKPGYKVEFKDGKMTGQCTNVSQTKDEIISEKDAKIQR